MEDSSRNMHLTQLQDRKNDSHDSDDQAQISPKSLEGFQNIESGISKLVDEVPSPEPEESKIEQQMSNLIIQGNAAHHSGYDHTGKQGYFATGFAPGTQGFTSPGGIEFAGGTPYFPNYNVENQEMLQGMVQGVGDFQHPNPQMVKPQSGKYSRQSSDGEGIGSYQNRQDLSERAVFGGPLSYNFDENCKANGFYLAIVSSNSWAGSQSDYQEQVNEQVQKFSYIFQSPDINLRGQNVRGHPSNPQYPSQGFYSHTGWEGYHQNTRASQGFQARASSFDKVNNQNLQHNYHQHYHHIHNNEDHETHSAASSDNRSVHSEGDVLNQNIYHTPNAQYGANFYGQYGPGMIPSNHASYGFTPNIQFSNSNQKYHGSGYQMNYSQGELPYGNLGDETTPIGNSPFGINDINISEQDVSLHKVQIGASPRRNSNEFRPTPKLIGSAQHMGLNYSDDKHHSQSHQQYKTPSPYRNNDHGLQNPSMGYNYSQRNVRYGGTEAQIPESFYSQGYNFQNQRVVNQQPHNSRPFYPTRGPMTDHAHIGMNPPPITRGGLVFHGQEQHIRHGGPMVAIQHNMHQNFQQYPQMQYHVHPPLRAQMRGNQTGSQEREQDYQPANFIPHHYQGNIGSKSGFNTPTHPFNDAVSASSQNSTGEVQDQPLFQLIKQYGECQNPTQKLEIIKGNVHKLALTQKGSRFLQKEVSKSSANTVQFFLDEISPHLAELMVDNYGNYFCQNLLESCSGGQRLSILKSIGDNFINICCDKKGTHTIQKMLELVNLQDEEDFIRNALKGRIIELAKNGQGTHVVQKVLGSFSDQRRDFIYEEVYDQFIDLAKDSNGLCVVKKIVQITKNPQQIALLMKKIQENAIDLVQDAFGNYAITEIIIKWDSETCIPIFKALKEKIGQLSSQKYSSNVIEKCFEKAEDKMKSQLIEELAKSDRLSSLIRNQYGNFVVQKALKIARGPDKDQLIHYIKRCIPDITDKKIKERWEKIVYDAEHGTNTASQGGANDTTSQGSNYQDQDGVENTTHRQVMVKDNKRANSSDNAAQ